MLRLAVLRLALPCCPAPSVENGKSFEELEVEYAIMTDRHYLSDPINSVHQMWEFDPQTALAIRPKK